MDREFEELEIESKRLLTETEFHQICGYFQLHPEEFHIQHNHYFDTSDFQLKERNAALRIRYKDGANVLTLKVRNGEGVTEKHQRLEKNEWTEQTALTKVSPGSIQTYIEKEWGIPFEALQYLGKLSTWRAEWGHDGGFIALDESHYLGEVDFELEYEGKSREHVRNVLSQIVEQIGMAKEAPEPPPKIQRFFSAKMRKKT
ncbi:uncharacterized protein YjbK [Geomicrobium halophilum]|uniref:Uncharacterized protein YjbK n=1 Tax=Geomicrobium halophilum TaxID=549000 RepID=A0A841PLC1_9BACL|nr:CYTH domain-containing protein [Geomicrobium halophilum]MBB6448484.1 uncharacterized protein YjbK [Geomicrobium halophilum]